MNKPVPAKSTAIVVARLIIAGDLSAARALRASFVRGSLAPFEARAIGGAVRAANARYGCAIDARELLWG